MKEITKEFTKDCGKVAIEGAKIVAMSSVIATGSTVTAHEILTAAYGLGCMVLKCTPEGKALEIAGKVIKYGTMIGGVAIATGIEYMLGVDEDSQVLL